ncbi:intermembrane phospholipid transport protein YdbH family protein [Shewanella youngdeokensis]|uniref:AsmA domain-containing protein n=1 Tax=Shewanella youngdeokensis TaxID=2999068 RepID=A0ABZ0K2A6_9GAMM|nr:hypothetical protein RGE70_07555 [Shewanella sp. DAU334]
MAVNTFGQQFRRLILISTGMMLTTILIATLYVGWNFQRLTIKYANDFLQPYQVQIADFSFTIKDLTHWQFPLLSLTINQTKVDIKDLNISFKSDTDFFALKIEDLYALSAKKLNIDLDPSVLRSAAKQQNNSPTIALDFSALPLIDIGETQLTIKNIASTKLKINIPYLKLDKKGNFSSEVVNNQQTVVKVAAQLNTDEWQANTQVNITKLQLLIADIYAAETTLFASKMAQYNNFEDSTSLLSPIYKLQGLLNSQQLLLNATVNSAVTLGVKSGQLQSQHSISNLKLQFNGLAGLTLIPQPIDDHKHAISSDPQQQFDQLNSQGELAFSLNGNIADLTLTVQPFELPIVFEPQVKNTLATPPPSLVVYSNALMTKS